MTQPPSDPFAAPPVPGQAATPPPSPPASDHPTQGYPPQGYPPTGAYAGSPAFVPTQPWGPLAGWGTRVAASLVDTAVQLIGGIPYVVGIVLFVIGAPDPGYESTTSEFELARPDTGNTGLMVLGGVLVVLGLVLAIGLAVWNRCFKQGRTGQSIGKRVMGIRLVDEHSGRPIGAGMAFVRELAHYLDGAVYIGYLWPLWDDKRQTFADKILGTLVVEVPK